MIPLPRGTEVHVNAALPGLPSPFRATVWDYSVNHDAYHLQPITGLYGADGNAIVGQRFPTALVTEPSVVDLLATVGRLERAKVAYERGIHAGLRLQTGEVTIDQLCEELADDRP